MSQSQMDEKAKLKVIIDHWVEHNRGHAQEFMSWAAKAKQAEVRRHIQEAARQMEEANDHLLAALEKLEEE